MSNVSDTVKAYTCKKCNTTNEFTVKPVANNLMAICDHCGGHIANIPYDEPRLYIGKYKGMAISEIDDLGYLRWAVLNLKLSKSVAQAIQNKLNGL